MALPTLALFCSLVWLQAAPTGGRPAPKPATAVPFEEAARRATEANAGGNTAEAIRWYREGVRQRASWDEGWWYLGALSYEQGDDSEAVRAFNRFLELKPDAGAGLALRGLAEFRLTRYDAALGDLTRGL